MASDVASGSTFRAALPYGVATLAVAAVGVGGSLAVLSSATPSLAATITAIACGTLGLMGAYGFIGVVIFGLFCTGDPQRFQDHVYEVLVAGAGMALAAVAEVFVKAMIRALFR